MSGDIPKLGPLGDLTPGEIRIGETVYVGAMPVRSELAILPQGPRESIGAKEWAEHGNCMVYVFNNGPLNADWTLAEGGQILVRSTNGGWWMSELLKDKSGWHTKCGDTRVPIVWSDTRACWVSTVEV